MVVLDAGAEHHSVLWKRPASAIRYTELRGPVDIPGGDHKTAAQACIGSRQAGSSARP
jgi:hypothetical protein